MIFIFTKADSSAEAHTAALLEIAGQLQMAAQAWRSGYRTSIRRPVRFL